MHVLLARLAFGSALLLTAAPHAGELRHGELYLQEPWARATPAAARVGAGYLVIVNEGDEADRLLTGEAAFAGRIELHETATVEGVMRMRPLADGLTLPPGETVTLEPGGLHIMFMQLQEPLTEGEERSVTLGFERAGEVEVVFTVRGMAAGGHRHAQ
jgi:copper(I)-binding protein